MSIAKSFAVLVALVFTAESAAQAQTASENPAPAPAAAAPAPEAPAPAPPSSPTAPAAEQAPVAAPAAAPPSSDAPQVIPPAAAPAAVPQGPGIDMPAEPVEPAPPLTAAAPASTTTVGGYAEMHFNVTGVSGPGKSDATVDLHRFVIFVGHEFTPKLRFYSELEVEHAVVSSEDDPGEVEIEQAFLDYKVADDVLGIRAGVVLIPFGIMNQVHEPPSFNGVERPNVDVVIIPTTWREGGIGVFGTPVEGFRYQLYVTGGFNAEGFTAEEGIRDGHGEVAEQRANGLAVSGRAEYEPTLGVVAGLSGYYGLAGPNAKLFNAAGAPLELDVPVLGLAADARAKKDGFEARVELAYFHIGDTAALRIATDGEGNSLGIDVGSALIGAYAEVAYDVLRLAAPDSEQQLLPFVRLERHDTMFRVNGRARTAADDAQGVTEVALGLTYRPIPQAAFKSDFIWANPSGAAPTTGRLDLGVAVMY